MKKIITLLILLLFAATVFAMEITELEKYKGKNYGSEYFYAVEGEISGKAAPGVEAVLVNGQPVEVDVDLSFETPISLKKGQKYLTIETRYKGLNFIKQYLVIRHPSGKEPLKIHVPRQEFENILKNKKETTIQPEKTKKEVKKPAKKKQVLKKSKPAPTPIPDPIPTPSPQEDWLGFDLMKEIEPGKIFMVQIDDGKYSASLYIPKTETWVSLDKISYQELKELLKDE